MKNKVFLFMLVLVMGILAACGTSDEGASSSSTTEEKTEEAKVLRVGTSADYAPFEYVDTAKSDEIIGFDIDLANLIAERLGYTLQFTNTDFNSLILDFKRINLILSLLE